MDEIILKKKEVVALIGCVNSYIRICNNSTPEPPKLTKIKEDFIKQLKNVIKKLEKINK
jgi:hypothetical protein